MQLLFWCLYKIALNKRLFVCIFLALFFFSSTPRQSTVCLNAGSIIYWKAETFLSDILQYNSRWYIFFSEAVCVCVYVWWLSKRIRSGETQGFLRGCLEWQDEDNQRWSSCNMQGLIWSPITRNFLNGVDALIAVVLRSSFLFHPTHIHSSVAFCSPLSALLESIKLMFCVQCKLSLINSICIIITTQVN